MSSPPSASEGDFWSKTVWARRNGELQFRRLLDKLPAGAYTCDPQGLITYYNPQVVAIWGRAPKLNDPTDRFCGSFKLFSSEGNAINHDRCWMALALNQNSEYNGHEIVIERPDGQRLTALAYANPIRDDDGTLLGAVNVLIDITDRKRAENSLREADRCKDEFLATLAHELRNPLAPIRHALEILRLEAPANSESRWAMEIIDRQMHQMTRLVDDLLDVSRITRNKLELRKKRLELADVLRAAMETSQPLLEAGGHQLTVQLPTDALHVYADATRLSQAISNLLNNAAKYTESGGTILLSAERQGSDAVITVRDNGIGISAGMLPRIFDMFAQAEGSTDRASGGLGIGLTLVKRLIELHEGSVAAHSEGLGKGSEFTVRLPVILDLPKPVSSDDATIVKPSSVLRILVADDNKDSVRSLGVLLRLTGHEVRTTEDGVEAVELAETYRPDVMLLDIGMPKMNGFQCAQHLRKQSWGKELVLIALTGWGQEDDRQRSKDAGFDHHIVKPIDLGALMKLLASLDLPARQVSTVNGS